MNFILAVAAGGAVGAVARHLVISNIGTWTGHGFPWGTVTVNVAGSFILGVLVQVMAQVWTPSPELRGFLVVGILGAFTTFSTFSLDTALLYERGSLAPVFAYVAGSVLLSIAALFLGLRLVRIVI